MSLAQELQDAVYGSEFGVLATLTGTGGSQFSLTAIDGTAGAEQLSPVGVQTEVPTATVRASDLATLGLSPLALDGMLLQMNGGSWLVTSHRPLPSPLGEGDGEYLLLLEDTQEVVIGPASSVPLGDYALAVDNNGDLVIVAPDGTQTLFVVATGGVPVGNYRLLADPSNNLVAVAPDGTVTPLMVKT